MVVACQAAQVCCSSLLFKFVMVACEPTEVCFSTLFFPDIPHVIINTTRLQFYLISINHSHNVPDKGDWHSVLHVFLYLRCVVDLAELWGIVIDVLHRDGHDGSGRGVAVVRLAGFVDFRCLFELEMVV